MTTPDENAAQNPGVTELPNPGATQVEPGTEAPKKRRGRPPKNPALSAESPGESSGHASTGPKKRAGKMSGDKIDQLARQLQGIHILAATITNLPEIGLHEQEARALADSVATMASHYDLNLDGRTGAAIQLLATAAMIYGPRYFAIRARMNQPVQGHVMEVKPNEQSAKD